jgi:hypothetical protein
VVLERVEIACFGAEPERKLGDLSGRAGVVGRELPAVCRLLEAASARGEDDGRGVDFVLAAARAPAVFRGLERRQRALRECRP